MTYNKPSEIEDIVKLNNFSDLYLDDRFENLINIKNSNNLDYNQLTLPFTDRIDLF